MAVKPEFPPAVAKRVVAIHQISYQRAEHAGYDPTALTKLGGHSLRTGFVSQSTPTDLPSPARPATPASTSSNMQVRTRTPDRQYSQ